MAMELLLKNSEGKPSLSFTMVYTSFLACLLWFILSIFKIQHIKDFDVTTASGFLSPMMALYFSRRWTDSRSSAPNSAENNTTNS
jgi:hypothetical protein